MTGGCGFVGSHLVDRLVQDGHRVRVYDVLEPQVHGRKSPSFLNKDAEYVFADLRDQRKLKKSLQDIEVVFHEAAQVGVGQSMYEIDRYVSQNASGTGILLDIFLRTSKRIRKLIVASSMSVYGEGAYRCLHCGIVAPPVRSLRQLAKNQWEVFCPSCRRTLDPVATQEEKMPAPTSVYAITKLFQEQLCLTVGRAYRIPTVALRYFNIYGPRQSLRNPYTGVTALFLTQIKAGKQPCIFEDGLQTRDFIYVSDIVTANILAMEKSTADYETLNVGTGRAQTIRDVAERIIQLYQKNFTPRILREFRVGDIRHCCADIGKITQKLGFAPRVPLPEGLRKLTEWSAHESSHDFTHAACRTLRTYGLMGQR